MPGSTVVEQAWTRRPSASSTQQSWQAPIRQKPARIVGANSKRLKLPRWVRMAVMRRSPEKARAGSPSIVKSIGAPRRPPRR